MNSLYALNAFPPTRWSLQLIFKRTTPEDAVEVLGLHFPNRIGLAAGFDKDARYMHCLASLGFGHVEVGTVTPLPQSGNPKPRLFRLKPDEAIINRMGFNNRGVEAMVAQLKDRPKHIIIGGNIGKNKDTPNENALDDYMICFKALHSYVDYFVVNVSSPNTPGLRALQEKGPLTEILQGLKDEDARQAEQRPILLKIAPDLGPEQLDDIVDIVVETNIAGIIATNTTISRDGLETDSTVVNNIGNGGLSGRPVLEKSTAVLRYLQERAAGRFQIIGVGGIHNTKSAQQKLDAGASLVQVYSGFIFEGPSMVKRIVTGLRAKL